MNLTLQRDEPANGATVGQLLIEGEFECYTLEDKVREVPGKPVSEWKIPQVTAIPRGRYRLVIDFSTRFQRMMPHLLDVPGFTGIRIHPGNSAADTEGCILVGHDRGKAAVWNSHMAFKPLFDKLEKHLDAGGECWIDVLSHDELIV